MCLGRLKYFNTQSMSGIHCVLGSKLEKCWVLTRSCNIHLTVWGGDACTPDLEICLWTCTCWCHVLDIIQCEFTDYFLRNPQVFAPHWKSYTFECSQSFSAFSMNKMSNNFLLGICFFSSPNNVLLLRIFHGSSRLTHACALKNLIRRPHSSEKREGKKDFCLVCVVPFIALMWNDSMWWTAVYQNKISLKSVCTLPLLSFV